MSAPDAEPKARPTVLVLGGTTEARRVAEGLTAIGGVRVITALAGRTEAPHQPPGEVRVGGFGGPDGLARWLRDARVVAVVDATHPFAATISANAEVACARVGVPRIALVRPAWEPGPQDLWHRVPDTAAAAAILPTLGRRAFLTVGITDLMPFAALRGMTFVVRAASRPVAALPFPAEIIVARGPFRLEDERRLLASRRIEVVVTKASGGSATAPKLAAAREHGLPVVMIERPPPPSGPTVATVEDAVRWALDRAARLGH